MTALHDQVAYFGCGSHAALEAIFSGWGGVTSTRLGRMAANDQPLADGAKSPGYQVVEVCYESSVSTYSQLLELFWSIYEPFPDLVASHRQRLEQYAPVIFCVDDGQLKLATEMANVKEDGWDGNVRTRILRAGTFEAVAELEQGRFLRSGLREPYDGPRSSTGCGSIERYLEVNADPALLHDLPKISEALGDVCSLDEMRNAALGDDEAVLRILTQWYRWMNLAPIEVGEDDSKLSAGTLIVRVSVEVEYGAAVSRFSLAKPQAELDVLLNLANGNHLLSRSLGFHAGFRELLCEPRGENSPRYVSSGSIMRLSRFPYGFRPTPSHHLSNVPADSWFDCVPDVRVNLGCKCGHQLVWSRGELYRSDMQGGSWGEHTLLALARSDCICTRVMEIWSSKWFSRFWLGAGNPFVHSLIAMQPGYPVYGPAYIDGSRSELMRWHGTIQGQWKTLPDPTGRNVSSDPSINADLQDVIDRQVRFTVWGLPPELGLRWVLGGMADLAARYESISQDDRSVLEASVFAALRGALGRTVTRQYQAHTSVRYIVVEMRYVDNGVPQIVAAIDGDVATLQLEVSYQWIAEVWCAGLAVVGSSLVLQVRTAGTSNDLEALCVSWNPTNVDAGLDVEWRKLGRQDGKWTVEPHACVDPHGVLQNDTRSGL